VEIDLEGGEGRFGEGPGYPPFVTGVEVGEGGWGGREAVGGCGIS